MNTKVTSYGNDKHPKKKKKKKIVNASNFRYIFRSFQISFLFRFIENLNRFLIFK